MATGDEDKGKVGIDREPLSESDEGVCTQSIIKSPLIIKSSLINPIPYTTIELTIKISNTVRQLIPEDGRTSEIIKALLTILNSRHGPRVLQHLLEYGAYTYREMQLKLGIPKGTISYITGRLQFCRLVEFKTVVLPVNPRTPGPRPHVYVLKGAPPECAVDCIKRYYSDRLPVEEITIETPQNTEAMDQIVDYYHRRGQYGKHQTPSKAYMIDRLRKLYPAIVPNLRNNTAQQIIKRLLTIQEASP